MGLWSVLLKLSGMLLLLVSLIYGVKLLKKGNVLLGLEWLVITVSVTHMMIFLFTDSTTAFSVSLFLDQFSRAIGIPVIAVAGLMAVTHRYKPSVTIDIVLFAIGIVVGLLFAFTGFVHAAKPYLLLAGWTAFSLYLAYFAKRLWDARERGQALNVICVLVTNQVIASTYDFYHIPGDDALHSIFYTFALAVWSYLIAGTYYAYCAFERVNARLPAGT